MALDSAGNVYITGQTPAIWSLVNADSINPNLIGCGLPSPDFPGDVQTDDAINQSMAALIRFNLP